MQQEFAYSQQLVIMLLRADNNPDGKFFDSAFSTLAR
jgi:hypothetical protein